MKSLKSSIVNRVNRILSTNNIVCVLHLTYFTASTLLWSILADYKLPLDVQLDTSKVSNCKMRTSTDRYAITGVIYLKLLEEHTFKYIYGNHIFRGIIYNKTY